MRHILFLLLATTCLTSSAAAQRSINRRLPLAPDGAVRITNFAGVVRLHG